MNNFCAVSIEGVPVVRFPCSSNKIDKSKLEAIFSASSVVSPQITKNSDD